MSIRPRSAVLLAALLASLVSMVQGQDRLAFVASQRDAPAWLNLEQGKRAFSDKDFGAALVHFDAAIASRRTSFETADARLRQARATKAASGDSIRAALAAFAAEDFIQRDYTALARGRASTSAALLAELRRERISDSHRAFIDVLLAVNEYRDIGRLGDSMAELSRQVFLLTRYPEAEYWKGRIFFVEGELSLAETQYQRAYAMADSLDIPEERYTILYSLADIYELRGNLVAWENVMLRICEGLDTAIDAYLRKAMLATLVDAGFERFMTLYRLEPSYSIEANARLASFYLERGRAQALERAAITVNMILTKAIAMIGSRVEDYTWRGLEDFLRLSGADRNVAAYLAEAELYARLLTLADALYIQGARAPASYLWRTIASNAIGPEAAVARSRLAAPGSAVRRAAP